MVGVAGRETVPFDRRALLSAAVFQYSMSTQYQRRRALEQVLLAILLEQQPNYPLDIEEIRMGYKRLVRESYVSSEKLREVLGQLRSDGDVELLEGSTDHFRITGPCRERLEREREQWQSSIHQIVKRLFDSPQGLTTCYEQPFLELITEIALAAGNESASYLVNQAPIESVESKINDRMIRNIAERYPDIDQDRFRAGILRFFQSSDPVVTAILWHVTELGFALRLLGTDRPSKELAAETFKRTTFIIDTNVLIPFFISQDEYHDNAYYLLRALAKIGADIVVTDLTIREMEGVLDRDYALLKSVIDRGSTSILSKLDSSFLREYAAIGEGKSAEEFFDRYADIVELIHSELSAEIHNIEYRFDSDVCNQFADKLRYRYKEYANGNRTKTGEAAQHDAQNLIYTLDLRKTSGKHAWFVTLDTSLPGAVPNGSDVRTLSLSPRNVLPWLAAAGPVDEKEASRQFSKMFIEKLLPSSQFLHTQDFKALLSIQSDLDRLPEQDVEVMISEIRNRAPNIDPDTARGREAVWEIVSRVLADPSSASAKRLREADEAVRAVVDQREKDKAEYLENIAELRRAHEQHMQIIETEAGRARGREGALRFWVFIVVLSALSVGLFLYGLGHPILKGLNNIEVVFVEVILLGVLAAVIGRVALPTAVGRGNIPYMGPNYRAIIGD